MHAPDGWQIDDSFDGITRWRNYDGRTVVMRDSDGTVLVSYRD